MRRADLLLHAGGFGSPRNFRRGHERNLTANLAIAVDPDTAMLLARSLGGVTLVAPGDEALKLAPIPLANLLTHDLPLDAGLLALPSSKLAAKNWCSMPRRRKLLGRMQGWLTGRVRGSGCQA